MVACAAPGCSSGSAATGADDAGGGAPADAGPPPTYAPTYSAVWKEILQPSCALLFCHGGSGDYLEFTSEAEGYDALVDAAAEGPLCESTGLQRVAPYHPEASLLYLKVTQPPCGQRMPAEGAGPPLDSRQTQQIRNWIEAGAPND